MKKQEIKNGAPVIYWRAVLSNGIKEQPYLTEISSEVFEVGANRPVCKIKGQQTAVSVGHLDPLNSETLMAAQLSGLEITTEEFTETAQAVLMVFGLLNKPEPQDEKNK